MRAFQHDIQQIVLTHGVIAIREDPELRGAIDWQVRSGALAAVLPGVYAPADVARQPLTRIVAVPRWDPDAILTHEAAAVVSFWPELPVPVVRASVKHRRGMREGYEFSRRRIPPELLLQRGDLRLTAPALTALDLCATLGGDAIDQALRTRFATLAGMHQALTLIDGQTGNGLRRDLLLDSRDEPWSSPERQLHRLLRAAGFTGWAGNQPVSLPDGTMVYVDVLFRKQRLAIEIDGRKFHSASAVFESDRRRQNSLVLGGWTVLRLTWSMIQEDPQRVVAMIRDAIAAASVA